MNLSSISAVKNMRPFRLLISYFAGCLKKAAARFRTAAPNGNQDYFYCATLTSVHTLSYFGMFSVRSLKTSAFFRSALSG